jgi:hypothetical protein
VVFWAVITCSLVGGLLTFRCDMMSPASGRKCSHYFYPRRKQTNTLEDANAKSTKHMYVYMHINIYVCMHIFILYVCRYVHTHTHTNTHTDSKYMFY